MKYLPCKSALAALSLTLFSVCAQDYTAKGTEYRQQEATASAASAEKKKPFTVSATLREEYDDNIFTTHDDKVDSFKTIVSPSLLFNYPIDQTLYAARYTFGMTYYSNRDDDEIDLSHEFLGRINHAFSSRFNIDVRERFRYSQEPEIFDNSAIIRRNGDYLANTFSLQGNMQWTPKFGTITTYTNDLYDYRDEVISSVDDRMVHDILQDFRFLILPTTTLLFGGQASLVDYNADFLQRDYEAYTGTVGVEHQFSPQITVGGRLGGTYTDLENGNYVSPYGNVTFNWVLGARSMLDASYTHYISQSDSAFFSAQETDVFTLGGRYYLTPRFHTRLQGLVQIGTFDQELSSSASASSFDENVYAVNLGFGFKINNYLDLEWGYSYTWVDSEVISRDYDRNQVFIGIRGTY